MMTKSSGESVTIHTTSSHAPSAHQQPTVVYMHMHMSNGRQMLITHHQKV